MVREKRLEVLGVARKVFQDFANVLCQRFVEVPSNRDLVNLVLFGGGTLVLDLMNRRAACNRYPIEPLPYSEDARRWLFTQMAKHEIPNEELSGASLTVEYAVEFIRQPNIPIIPTAKFDFVCTAAIASSNRVYTSVLKAQKSWSLGAV
jgi:hypothetical protein